MYDLNTLGKKAKSASRILAVTGTAAKNAALLAAADALLAHTDEILAANNRDLEAGKAAGLRESLLDRLALSPERIAGMAGGIRKVAALPDPVGQLVEGHTLPNGIQLSKVRVPMGVIGIIYEARPNVTSDAAALCLKAGNAVILRGGKEAFESNKAVTKVMREALAGAGLPEDCVALVEDTSRETATALMRLNAYLDVLIPRGGGGLIRSVVENATVPVIETGVGNCHVYVEQSANVQMAADIVFNAKTQRPSVCNAAESLLVDAAIAEKALPVIAERLSAKKVELRGCPETCRILPGAVPACEEDYDTEFLDYILSVKVVSGVEEAVAHINAHGTGHSECIVTGSYEAAQRFTDGVDAAAVYVNASTRFTDGEEFGLGAEIGISTQKLHARGPMGLLELTSTKYILRGNGQIR
ncbi:MAG: glutamate-5-semialdehyde dehydrogenase [Clostridiales bacterium]|nr:glutamate-5-semialdehyde dehydrogenase [Clostridiales bacterium]